MLCLHDALPISAYERPRERLRAVGGAPAQPPEHAEHPTRQHELDDLPASILQQGVERHPAVDEIANGIEPSADAEQLLASFDPSICAVQAGKQAKRVGTVIDNRTIARAARSVRSEEHTSELQSLMRTSYAVFCFKKKQKKR